MPYPTGGAASIFFMILSAGAPDRIRNERLGSRAGSVIVQVFGVFQVSRDEDRSSERKQRFSVTESACLQ